MKDEEEQCWQLAKKRMRSEIWPSRTIRTTSEPPLPQTNNRTTPTLMQHWTRAFHRLLVQLLRFRIEVDFLAPSFHPPLSNSRPKTALVTISIQIRFRHAVKDQGLMTITSSILLMHAPPLVTLTLISPRITRLVELISPHNLAFTTMHQ